MLVPRHWTVRLRAAHWSLSVALSATPVFAQATNPKVAVAPAPDASAPAAPAPTDVPAVAPVAIPATEPSPEPATQAPAEAPSAAPTALPGLPPPAPAEAPAPRAAVGDDEHWYDSFVLRAFADSYFSLNYNTPKPQSSGNGVIRAFDTSNGFAVAWAGLDISHPAEPIGGTISLRFGPSAQRYNASCAGKCDADYGLQNVKQAFASFRPGGKGSPITLDFGKFDTIYGAEVADSQDNLNYTRGELYYNFQPFWHTGIRMAYEVGGFVGRVIVANDANKSNLGRGAINAGLQVGYSNDYFGVVAGALQSLKPDTTVANGGFIDTFIDVVATVNAGDFSLVGNFDLNVGYEAGDFWGASLAAGYSFVPAFGIALRGEYLAFTGDADLWTGTLTFDVKPIPDVENVVVRWDNRIEVANTEAFLNTAGDDTTKVWFGTVLGLVAYADLL